MLTLAVLTGCTSAAQAGAAPSTPVETEIPFSAPAGISDTDFDVDAFDPCSPFRVDAVAEGRGRRPAAGPADRARSRRAAAGGADRG